MLLSNRSHRKSVYLHIWFKPGIQGMQETMDNGSGKKQSWVFNFKQKIIKIHCLVAGTSNRHFDSGMVAWLSPWNWKIPSGEQILYWWFRLSHALWRQINWFDPLLYSIADFLVNKQHCKAFVIACNTASATAYEVRLGTNSGNVRWSM